MKKTFLFSMIALLSVSFIFMGCPQEADPPLYTVTFDSNEGTEVDPIKAETGSKIEKPADPTKEDNTFDGWYKEAGLENEWDFDEDTVTEDITLYAKWTSDEE